MKTNFLLAAAALLALTAAAKADSLVGVQKIGSMSAAHFNNQLKTVFGSLAPPPAVSPTDLYKLRYRSPNSKGKAIILSGLLVLPRFGAPKGLIVFAHGTLADRRLSPSRFVGKPNASEAEAATLAFASDGYAVAMPDYLGLGDDLGIHPFPLARLNSLSVVDLIGPARTAIRRQRVAVGPRLFMTGYSEGGAVAMWAVRTLEQTQNPDSRIFSAALMAGPYDLTGVTARSLIAPNTSQTLFAARLYLLAYLLHTAYKTDGIRLTRYVRPALAAVIVRVFDQNPTDEQIIKRLALAASLLGARNSVERITTPYFRETLRSSNAADPVMGELLKNDCYRWSPQTKMQLICLQTDAIVVSANTHKTIQTMRARGIGIQTVSEYTIQNTQLNHVTAVVPSLVQARRFFDGKSAPGH